MANSIIKLIVQVYLVLASMAGLGKISSASKRALENYGSNEVLEAIYGLGFTIFNLALFLSFC